MKLKFTNIKELQECLVYWQHEWDFENKMNININRAIGVDLMVVERFPVTFVEEDGECVLSTLVDGTLVTYTFNALSFDATKALLMCGRVSR